MNNLIVLLIYNYCFFFFYNQYIDELASKIKKMKIMKKIIQKLLQKSFISNKRETKKEILMLINIIFSKSSQIIKYLEILFDIDKYRKNALY